MTESNFRSAAFAAIALAAGFSAAPALAQDVVVPAGARVVYAQPAAEADALAVPPDAFGHFTCAFNESHTRLERESCGGTHYRYGG